MYPRIDFIQIPVRRVAVGVLMALIVVVPLIGQAVTGTIGGVVTDPTSGAVGGAAVTVKNPATGLTRTATTARDGTYRIPFLPVGTYEVSAEQAGFQRLVRSGVVLQADQVAVIDLQLTVGAVTQSVEVTGDAPLLDTGSHQLGAVIGEKQVLALPLNGRNFVHLVTLVPGTTTGRQGEVSSGGTGISFRGTSSFNANGFRSLSNNFLLDGVDNNYSDAVTTFSLEPVIDSLQEFKVLTANQPAEYGNFMGGVVNIHTKSGSNEIHGSAYEFLRNSALDAKNFFDDAKRPIPPFRQNQFGGTIGGPIRRNSTFFFADYQGFRVSQGQTFIGSVPVSPLRSGDFRGLNTIYDPLSTRTDPATGTAVRDAFPQNQIPANRMDPAAIKTMQYYPAANLAGQANNLLNNPVLTREDNSFDARVDQVTTAKDNLFGRYSFGKAVTSRPSPLSAPNNPFGGGGPVTFSGDFDILAQSVVVNEVHTFSPRVINEFRFGYSRFSMNALPEGFGVNPSEVSGIPNLALSSTTATLPIIAVPSYTTLGPAVALPLISHSNTFQYVDNLSVTRGSHDFKFGVSVIRHRRNFFDDAFPTGIFTFNQLTTATPAGAGGHPFASYLLGHNSVFNRSNVASNWGTRNWVFGGFAQDSWRAGRRVTINLGLRYEIFTPWVEVADRQSTFDAATGAMALAGEGNKFGRALTSTDRNNFGPRVTLAYQPASKTAIRAGFGISYFQEYTGLNSYMTWNFPFNLQQQVVDNPAARPTMKLETGPPPLPVPNPNQPSGQVRRLNPDLKMAYGMQYNLTVQHELTRDLLLETGYLGSRGLHMLLLKDENMAFPGAGAVPPRRPYFGVNPNVGTVLFLTDESASNYHAFITKVEKRFSRGLTFLGSYTFAKAIQEGEGSAGGSYGEQPLDPRNLDMDRGLASFDRKHRGVISFAWDIPGQAALSRSPAVVWYIIAGWSANGILTMESGPPFQLSMTPSLLNTGTANRPNRICDGGLDRGMRDPVRWFNTACFVQTANFTFGSAGLNILRAPGNINVDLSLFKTFPITERVKLQFRAESFNLTNTPHFGLPNGAIGTPAAGRIGGAGPARQIQFAFKLVF